MFQSLEIISFLFVLQKDETFASFKGLKSSFGLGAKYIF